MVKTVLLFRRLARANFNSPPRLANANQNGERIYAMMPLTLAAVGEENTIQRVAGKPEVKKHLENLGFVVGGDVKVLTGVGENVIVKVKEARIAISAEMAQKIYV